MTKPEGAPQEPRRGWIENGHRPGDLFDCAAMRRQERARIAVPVFRYWQTEVDRPTPDSARGQDGAGNRADPAGRHEARLVFGGRQSPYTERIHRDRQQ